MKSLIVLALDLSPVLVAFVSGSIADGLLGKKDDEKVGCGFICISLAAAALLQWLVISRH